MFPNYVLRLRERSCLGALFLRLGLQWSSDDIKFNETPYVKGPSCLCISCRGNVIGSHHLLLELRFCDMSNGSSTPCLHLYSGSSNNAELLIVSGCKIHLFSSPGTKRDVCIFLWAAVSISGFIHQARPCALCAEIIVLDYHAK